MEERRMEAGWTPNEGFENRAQSNMGGHQLALWEAVLSHVEDSEDVSACNRVKALTQVAECEVREEESREVREDEALEVHTHGVHVQSSVEHTSRKSPFGHQKTSRIKVRLQTLTF